MMEPPVFADENRLLSPSDVAALLDVKTTTLEKWRETGRVELPFVKLGAKAIKYRYRDVVAFINGRVATSTQQARLLDAVEAGP
ncbi:MAG: helix-turn-helix domain-containing protein [Terricaulis sp.]